MNVFINCERIKNEYVESLINKLELNGFNLFTSPENPLDGYDIKWKNWYDSGFEEIITKINIFISIITDSWESSTWMAYECGKAEKYLLYGKINKMFFIDLRTKNFMSKGMLRYLKEKLPNNIDEIIKILK